LDLKKIGMERFIGKLKQKLKEDNRTNIWETIIIS
jgi:hypothetical protein